MKDIEKFAEIKDKISFVTQKEDFEDEDLENILGMNPGDIAWILNTLKRRSQKSDDLYSHLKEKIEIAIKKNTNERRKARNNGYIATADKLGWIINALKELL